MSTEEVATEQATEYTENTDEPEIVDKNEIDGKDEAKEEEPKEDEPPKDDDTGNDNNGPEPPNQEQEPEQEQEAEQPTEIENNDTEQTENENDSKDNEEAQQSEYNDDNTNKTEEERLQKEKEEADRIAKEEAEREAKEETDRLQKEKEERKAAEEAECKVNAEIGMKFEMDGIYYIIENIDNGIKCVQSQDINKNDFPNEITLTKKQLNFVTILTNDEYNNKINKYNEEKKEMENLYDKLENAVECKSLLKKYLTRDIFNKLKHQKTEQGCDLKSCIKSGIDNLDSGVGVYASDSDAYVVFGELLNPIIIDYHKLDTLENFKHPKQNFSFDDSFPADLDPDGKFVISTRVRVARNITGYPLRGGMNEQQTMELEQTIKDILEGFEDEDLKGKYYPLNNMDEETRTQLVADHFLFKKGDRFLESAGINQFWPNGRGIFFNDNKTFLVWVNEEDQLRIISMEQGANIKSVFGRLEKAVAAINAKLEFAYNESLGYLTACPTNIGCGERASVHIKVPLTSQNETLFNEIADRNNLQIRGIHGEHSESKGGIFDVSNKRRLGISEWDGVKDLITGCKELIESEMKLQNDVDDIKIDIGMKFAMGEVYYSIESIDKYVKCKQINELQNEEFPNEITLSKTQIPFTKMMTDNEYKIATNKYTENKKPKSPTAKDRAKMFEQASKQKKEKSYSPQKKKKAPKKLRVSKLNQQFAALNINPAALKPGGGRKGKTYHGTKEGGLIDQKPKVEQATITKGKRKKRKKKKLILDENESKEDMIVAPQLFYDEKAVEKARKEKEKQKKAIEKANKKGGGKAKGDYNSNETKANGNVKGNNNNGDEPSQPAQGENDSCCVVL